MTTRVTRTYTYICPSCGTSATISKSSSSIFESLELEESDIPRCVNCRATICSNCATHGLGSRCFTLIPVLFNSSDWLEKINAANAENIRGSRTCRPDNRSGPPLPVDGAVFLNRPPPIVFKDLLS